MKEQDMKEPKIKLETSLMIPEKDNILKRFFKWVKNLFSPTDDMHWTEDKIMPQAQEITIPKAVKMPERIEKPEELDTNSIEYLYQLTDKDLEHLDKQYNQQMEEAKTELEKLSNILQTYKQSIKKLQGQVSKENG